MRLLFITALFLTEISAAQAHTVAPASIGPVDYWYSHRDQDPQSLPFKPIGNEVVYQIFVDRFSDGNAANNCLFDRRLCDPEHRDFYRYWGGDLRGVINQMSYIKELGISRVWLTPIFENQLTTIYRNRYNRDIEMTSYHGYWFKDLFRLNPMFTDQGEDDFSIVSELVAKGQPQIKFYLDSVANHTSPADPTAWSAELANRLYPLDHRDGIRRSQRGALYERGQYVMGLDEDEQRARENIPANYQRYFHGFGPIEDFNNQFQLENFQLDALADLDQTNGVVADYLKRAHAFWLEHFPNLAGYRMDTIKHVPFAYWQRFDSELFERFPNAEVIGEYYGGGPFNAGSRQYFRNTHATMFDFDFRSAVQDVFLNRAPMSRFTELWSADPGLKDARSLVTFIDNHDMPRLRGQGMSYRAMRQAIALMFASRGIPCVYYGLEQDLFVEQDPGDPYNRPMQTRFDRQHQFYREIKKLAALRRDNTALRYGSTHVVHLSENILGFERVEGDSKVLFITSKNPIEGHNNFDLTGLHLPDGLYSDILSDQEYVVRGGRVAVSLANGDTVLLSSTRRHDLGSRIPE